MPYVIRAPGGAHFQRFALGRVAGQVLRQPVFSRDPQRAARFPQLRGAHRVHRRLARDGFRTWVAGV